MNNPLSNIKKLKADMIKEKWPLDIFKFINKQIKYVVVVSLYMKGDIKPDKYASVKLTFLDFNDDNRRLECAANSNKLYIDDDKLRAFFGIEYGKNNGYIMNQFKNYLGEFIPGNLIKIKPDIQNKILYKELSKSDSEDPNKIYCFAIKRNGTYQVGPDKGKKIPRTWFNSQKTEMKRNKLYNMFKIDPYISFCYSSEPSKYKSDSEIAMTYKNKN